MDEDMDPPVWFPTTTKNQVYFFLFSDAQILAPTLGSIFLIDSSKTLDFCKWWSFVIKNKQIQLIHIKKINKEERTRYVHP